MNSPTIAFHPKWAPTAPGRPSEELSGHDAGRMAAFFLVTFGMRMAYILLLQTYKFDIKFETFGFPGGIDHFFFGFETGSIARSIATGHGFSSPFGGDTGSTAWLAPIYPYTCAAVFKVFGIFSNASALVMLSLNSFFAGLNCIVIFKIAERCFGRRVAIWSSWAWALNPQFMRWPATWVWEISLSALLLSVLFLFAIRLAERSDLKAWLGFGGLWGVAALTNPSLLAFLPFSMAWPAFHLRRGSRPYLRPVLIAVMTCVVVVSPWMVRNRMVFHKTVFIRDNFGFEMRLGNFHNSNALGWVGIHPTKNKREHDKYVAMGETAYIAQHQQEVVEFVRSHPGEFAKLTFQRMADFWDGRWLEYANRTPQQYLLFFSFSLAALWGLLLALGRKIRGGMLFACLFFYPAAYYLTYTDPRYRHPVEPEMVILAIYFLWSLAENLQRRVAR